MSPIYVDGCLDWFHAPAAQASGIGVLLCPALGREARWTYRTMRQLADRFAAAGYPVLRLEYPGTGDSADLPGDEDPLAAWRRCIDRGAEALRERSGVSKIMLCGLRFGALMAVEAAQRRDDVVALALLAPVLSGRNHARELRLAAIGGEGDLSPHSGIELDGVILPNTTLSAIGAVDHTRGSAAPAPHLLVLDDGAQGAAFAARMNASGARATHLPFAGYAEMMRVATSNRVPHHDLDAVVAWLREAGIDEPPGAHAPAPSPRARVATFGPDHREEAILFGPDRRLVGVLCEPADQTRRDRAVLITNTGGDPRAGIGRFGVRLARRLAARGIASLRFDFAGLGDSRLDGDVDCHLYDTDRAGDIAAALDLLEARGFRRFAAAGLCTGAYHMLRAAVAERRIGVLMAVNQVAFAWRLGDVVEVAQRAMGQSTSHYRELLRRPKTWARVARGEIDVGHLTRLLTRRLLQRVLRAGAPLRAVLGLHSAIDEPRRIVEATLRGGARMLMLYGFSDPGIAVLEANFGPHGRALAARPGAAVHIERGLDHTLSRIAMQDRTIDILLDYLAREMPGLAPIRDAAPFSVAIERDDEPASPSRAACREMAPATVAAGPRRPD